MIDIKPPEEEKVEPFEGIEEVKKQKAERDYYMLSPNLDTRWTGAYRDVSNVIYENKDLAHDDYVSITMRMLIDISYLLEEGREYAYMAHHYAKPMKEISNTLKEILKEMRKRKV